MGKKQQDRAGQKLVKGLSLHEDGEYRYRIMRDGKLYTGRTGTCDLEEAQGFLAQLKAYIKQVSRGLIQPQATAAPAPAPRPMTLGELVSLWESTKCNRSKSHRQTTVGSIRNHFQNLLNTPVESITTEEVNAAIQHYMTTKGVNPGRGGKPCLRDHSARGANKVLQRLRDVVRFGLEGKHVASINFKFEKVKEEETQKHTLPLRWVDKFFDLVDRAKNPHLGSRKL